MASWFRSSSMQYVELYVAPTAATKVVQELGDIKNGIVQFTDVSSYVSRGEAGASPPVRPAHSMIFNG
jgi:hypothetical protein